jgi:hypothetical protein
MVGIFDIITDLIVKDPSRIDQSNRARLRKLKEYTGIVVTYRSRER